MMSQARFFSSDSAKDTPKDIPVVDESKKPAELPIFLVDFTSSKLAFYGYSSDLDSCHLLATNADEKSQTPVICRSYQRNRPYRDQLYKKDVEVEQRIGHHPNLLRFMGIVEQWGSIIVYENGGTAGNLHDMLFNIAPDPESQHPFSSRARWAEDAISAVAHIHNLGLVHGEITPANIVFDRASDTHVHLKIANMLSARFDSEYIAEESRHRCDPFRRPPDTTRWLPPETLSLKEVADEGYYKRKDIWQLGILIAELMLFKLPYSACAYTVQVVRVITKEPPFTRQELQNAVGPKFANFILQCCELNPEKRPTMKKIVDELWPEVLPELKEKVKSSETPAHHVGEPIVETPVSRLGM